MIFLHQLLDVLGRGAAGPGFVHAAARHQRNDRQHLGRCPQLHDREQVGEIIAQDVPGGADGIEAAHHALQCVAHRTHLTHDLNVEPGGVVLMQIHLHLGDELRLVRPIWIEPK